jgi:hypothetical protein
MREKKNSDYKVMVGSDLKFLYFICGLFNGTVINSCCTLLNDMAVNNESDRIWTEVIMA